jgi:hypothetical protein
MRIGSGWNRRKTEELRAQDAGRSSPFCTGLNFTLAAIVVCEP